MDRPVAPRPRVDASRAPFPPARDVRPHPSRHLIATPRVRAFDATPRVDRRARRRSPPCEALTRRSHAARAAPRRTRAARAASIEKNIVYVLYQRERANRGPFPWLRDDVWRARRWRVEAEKRLKRRTRVIFDRVSKAPFVTHK